MERLTIKSSTIFIAVGSKTKVYRSVDDVPPKLRRRLKESTNGINAATILIADRKGREEIVRAIQGLPNGIATPRLPQPPEPKGAPASRKRFQLDWRLGVEMLLPVVAGFLIWFAFHYK